MGVIKSSTTLPLASDKPCPSNCSKSYDLVWYLYFPPNLILALMKSEIFVFASRSRETDKARCLEKLLLVTKVFKNVWAKLLAAAFGIFRGLRFATLVN